MKAIKIGSVLYNQQEVLYNQQEVLHLILDQYKCRAGWNNIFSYTTNYFWVVYSEFGASHDVIVNVSLPSKFQLCPLKLLGLPILSRKLYYCRLHVLTSQLQEMIQPQINIAAKIRERGL